MKTVTIVLPTTPPSSSTSPASSSSSTTFRLALLEGTEPAALLHAVSARCGYHTTTGSDETTDTFYFTLDPPPPSPVSSSSAEDNTEEDQEKDEEEEDPLVIPLSTNLPDGMTLYVRRVCGGTARASAAPTTTTGAAAPGQQNQRTPTEAELETFFQTATEGGEDEEEKEEHEQRAGATTTTTTAPIPVPVPASTGAAATPPHGTVRLEEIRRDSGMIYAPEERLDEEEDDEEDDNDDANHSERFDHPNHSPSTALVYKQRRASKQAKAIHGSVKKFQRELTDINAKSRPIRARLKEKLRIVKTLPSPFRTGSTTTTKDSSKNRGEKAIGQILAYNMLGTDLANERTLLAWVRTILATIRTIFAYQKLFPGDGIPRTDDPTLFAASLMIATLLLMMSVYASHRYYSVLTMLRSEDKQETYEKWTLWPMIGVAVSLSFLTGIATYADTWW